MTDPEAAEIPHAHPGLEGLGEQGGGQMVRACDGKSLPKGDPAKTYLLRTFGGRGHEIWDVSKPEAPALVTRVSEGLKDTHKSWWECDTGIAYLVSGVEGWRTRRMTEVYDLSDPAKPVKIRDYGLVGQQPGASGAVPTELHGTISTGPQGNRIYFAYGTNKGGVVQIVDREKLLNGPKEPTPDNLRYPVIGQLDMLPLNGAHSVIPLGKMKIAEFAKDLAGGTRDIIMIVDESLVNECQAAETRQMVWFVDATVGSRPMVVSNFNVREAGGDFCTRGGRFGAHSAKEHGASLLQQARFRHLVQRGSARHRPPRPLQPAGSRLLHSVDHRGDRKTLHQGRGPGPLQDRDPEQQRRDRRARLHLRRRPRQYRPAHSGIDRRGARDRGPVVVGMFGYIMAGPSPAMIIGGGGS